MSLRAFTSAVILLSLATGCATQSGTPAPSSTSTAEAPREPTGERLRAVPPPDWLTGNVTETPMLQMSEYIAPETMLVGKASAPQQSWVEKITFERLNGTPVPDPLDFTADLANEASKACENGRLFNTESGVENGYPTAVVLITCRQHPISRVGQVTMVKVIQGNEALYTITRAKRIPSFEGDAAPQSLQEDIALWSLYLRAINVCDPTREAHAC